jgi:hypothetical protein
MLLLLGTLVFGACGSSGNKSSVDAKAAGDANTPTTQDTNFSGKGSKDFCVLAKSFEEDSATFGNAGTTAEMKKQFDDIETAVDKLASEAPGEIKSDVKLVVKYFKELVAMMKKYDYDFTKIPPAESEKLSTPAPDVEAAGTRLDSYVEKVCKIDADGDGDTDGIDNSASTGTDETTTTAG